MSVLWQAFPSEPLARRSIDTLLAAGVPGRDVRLITHEQPHDVRRERVGRFVGAMPPETRVGTFAGRSVGRWQARGSFRGDPDARRQGTFADADRYVIATYGEGGAHRRFAGRQAVTELLAAPPPGALDELDAGRSIVLAEVADIGAAEASARLADGAAAA